MEAYMIGDDILDEEQLGAAFQRSGRFSRGGRARAAAADPAKQEALIQGPQEKFLSALAAMSMSAQSALAHAALPSDLQPQAQASIAETLQYLVNMHYLIDARAQWMAETGQHQSGSGANGGGIWRRLFGAPGGL